MENIKRAVEKYRQLIFDAEKFIWHHPETGYKEFATSKYMEDTFRALGYDLVCAEDLTGFYTRIDTGRPGPEVLVMAELDSIICPAHPDSDPSTGAAHSCGYRNGDRYRPYPYHRKCICICSLQSTGDYG